ncbi:MAG: Coproporphyrinogen dehydrogenase [Lacrimispora sp.]|nr:Coproporphyrinogen dehydrogenase [Lacrimispora sp.]
MIGLILDDQSFEQDIRELLMAFYPGERFLHEENPDEEFRLLVRSVTGDDFFQLSLEDKEQKITKTSTTEVDFSDRFETKNRIKRMLYGMVGELTGRELPWGTLTGIRPVKIVMAKLLSGSNEEEVFDYMKDTYLTSDQKVNLSLEIAQKEFDLLSAIDYENGYSLYIGIPFCPTTCLYCSFTSFPISQWEKRMDDYLEALFKEMEFTARRMVGKTLDTVYVGGGTPTSLSAEHLEKLLGRMKKTFDFTNAKEFTVEAGRPDSITQEKLKVLKKYGVTRISINPQTMKEETLKIIGRRHTVEMVKDQFLLARSLGFDNINMDLIIGLPGEDMEDVRRTMEEIKSLGPDSITVHTLAIKRAARLNMFKEEYGDLKITGTQEMIDLTASYARSMGQEPYYLYRQKNMAGNFENVGYSVPGKACIYNILIMEEKQTIAACGAGTSTKVVFPSENRLERVENVKDVEQYIARIDEMIERKEKMLAKSEM